MLLGEARRFLFVVWMTESGVKKFSLFSGVLARLMIEVVDDWGEIEDWFWNGREERGGEGKFVFLLSFVSSVALVCLIIILPQVLISGASPSQEALIFVVRCGVIFACCG